MSMYNLSSTNIYLREEREKADIKFIGKCVGACIIGYIAIQELIGTVMAFEPLKTLIKTSNEFYYCVVIIMSLLALLIPFLIGGRVIAKKTGADVYPLNKPVSADTCAYMVAFGIFLCLVGNYAASWIVTLTDTAGVKLSQPDYDVPDGILGKVLYVAAIAVAPALAEEIAVRGVVMQPLRKYGDRFAILTSACVFALLHGNLIQAPFAFIAGIGLGYAVCASGSLWTGIIIHFVNNIYSVILEFTVNSIGDNATVMKLYYVGEASLYLIAVIGSIIYFADKNRPHLSKPRTYLSGVRKAAAFVLTPLMIIAIAVMAVITSNFVSA